MSKPRSNPLIAWCAVLALLLCQAVGFVDAHARDWTATQTQGDGCHGVPGEDSGKTVHIPCDSAQSVGETFKLPTVTPALLTFATALVVAPVIASSAPPLMHLAHAGAPPPLHLLYARLRN